MTPATKPTLVCIDWQKGFEHPTHWGTDRSTPGAEASGLRLLAAWRAASAPVIMVHHASTDPNSPLHPSNPGHQPMDGFATVHGEAKLLKSVNRCGRSEARSVVPPDGCAHPPLAHTS